MASVKDLRTKALSDMSYDELTDYINKAESAGYSRSTSKDLGKAEDLRKVLQPENYGSETVESAKNKLMNSTELSTQQELGLVPMSSGSSGFSSGSLGTQPSIDLNQIYEQEMNSQEIQDLEAELLAKKQARDEAAADINDNPFYSEATRVGKMAKLDEKANDEISTLESSLASRKADAQVKVNIATQQYNIESDMYQQNLQKLNLLISSGALMNASGDDIAQIALATGMSTDMVQGIQAQMQQDQVNPTVMTNTDNAGNVTVSVIDANTGAIISQNSLGSVGKASTTGSNNDSKEEAAFNSAVDSGIKQLKSGESWGTVWNRIKAMFPDVPDILIDYGLGLEWQEGGAYERYREKQTGTAS